MTECLGKAIEVMLMEVSLGIGAESDYFRGEQTVGGLKPLVRLTRLAFDSYS